MGNHSLFHLMEEKEMSDLGKVITGIVSDTDGDKTYVQKNGQTYRLISDEFVELGDTVKGFAYINTKNKKVITTNIPQVADGNFAWGRVVEVRKDLGVFVDIGLAEKDLVVSMDDLPEVKRAWPQKEDKLFVTIKVDFKERMWGMLATENYLKTLVHRGNKAQHNNNVSGYVVETKKSGSLVLLDDNYLAYIPIEEREEEPRLGQHIVGRVIGVREDGVLYISLKPRNHEVLDDDAQMILELIKRDHNKFIPFHDKSNPNEIQQYLGISKGQFKRAVGRLMKNKLVYQNENGTYLKE